MVHRISTRGGRRLALFNNAPVVAPDAELKVRYVFNPDSGAVPANLTLSEGDKTVEFPISGF